MSEIVSYASPGANRVLSQPVQLAGAIGIGGSLLGLAIFLGACFGFPAAFMFSLLPLAMGSAGFILAIVGGIQKNTVKEDSHVVAALFLNLFAIVGGLLEVAVWLKWHLFYHEVVKAL